MNDDLEKSIMVYDNLLNTAYHFILGRKKETVEIKLQFTSKELFHLLGLQYLTDLPELNSDREKIYMKIKCDQDFKNHILKSDNYLKIIDRVRFVSELDNFFYSNKTVFKFNNRANLFSLIKSDYILKNSNTLQNMYVFISKANDSETYFCRSAFTRDKSEPDYTNGHTSYTLLYKEKMNLKTLEKEVLYISPSYRKELEESSLASDQKLTIKNDLKAMKSKRRDYVSKPDAKTKTAYEKQLSIFRNRNIYTLEMLDIVADRLKAQLDDPHNSAVAETIKSEIEYIKNEAELRRKEPDKPTEKSISIVKNQINSDGTISSETAAEIPVPNVKKISQKAQRDTHTVVGSINSFISDVKSFFNTRFKKPKKQAAPVKKSPSNKPKSTVKTVDKNVPQKKKSTAETSKKTQEKSVHKTPENSPERPYFTREMLIKEARRLREERSKNPPPKKEKSHSHERE